MSGKQPQSPTWQEFHALLFRCRLATSFTEKKWKRYNRKMRRNIYDAIRDTFTPNPQRVSHDP